LTRKEEFLAPLKKGAKVKKAKKGREFLQPLKKGGKAKMGKNDRPLKPRNAKR